MDAKNLRDGDFFEVTGAVFKMINASWEALKLNIWTFVFLALVPAILFLVGLPFFVLPALTGSDAGTAIAATLAAFMAVVLLIVAVLFIPAITVAQLESVRGKRISFSEAFEQGRKFALRFLGLIILSALIIVAGFILLIIPGFLAIFFLSFAPYILIDKNTGVIESIKGSFELVKKYWRVVLGIVVVNVVIGIPNYVPVIGWIVTLALSIAYFCLSALVYVKIANKAVGAKKAKTA